MSTSDEAASEPREHTVTCPTFGASAPWPRNQHRPFCSLPCRLVDLGVWLDEGYRAPAD